MRGRKPSPLSLKVERGTVRPYRDLVGGNAVIDSGSSGFVAPNELPRRPDWLTAAGEEVWIDDIGRVAAGRLCGEREATLFANYCNLQGAIIQAWRKGEVPPMTALAESRKLAEILGIAGVKSRVIKGPPGSGGGSEASGNPFNRNRY